MVENVGAVSAYKKVPPSNGLETLSMSERDCTQKPQTRQVGFEEYNTVTSPLLRKHLPISGVTTLRMQLLP